jgi:hypothetical protein
MNRPLTVLEGRPSKKAWSTPSPGTPPAGLAQPPDGMVTVDSLAERGGIRVAPESGDRMLLAAVGA